MGRERARYHCPVEVAVDAIGGKWAVVILARLKQGACRYGELRRQVPGITEKMLTERLRELERNGLVVRTAGREGAVTTMSYRLTEEAEELAPALQALYDWGERRAQRRQLVIEPA
ncbi:winged helix-turn-helix transcriptional regulator [Sciscionella marina]|uniref:winged helix-turn-helix transcriptional regulator n=1 Tax=Sciscionella marina TaxID=508770 RepID=UPI00058ACBA5|nr:helix-turn-helix domain-containing protein [Sciscionella marina]